MRIVGWIIFIIASTIFLVRNDWTSFICAMIGYSMIEITKPKKIEE